MPERKRSVVRSLGGLKPGSPAAYVLAAACVGIAALLRWLLALSLDGVFAFPLFFAAIVFASLLGGLGPALFAAVLGMVTGWFMRSGTLLPVGAGQTVNFVLGLGCAALIAFVVDRHRHLTRQSRSHDELHAIVVEELRHRLKNKASTVQAIVALHLREHPDSRDKILKGLAALNAADNLVTASNGKGARLADILNEELAPYQPARAEICGPEIRLPSRLATTLALVLHELATNAAKYGALSTGMGRILVEWTIVARELKFTWREEGGPAVTSPIRQGFGTRLFSLALGPFQGRLDARFPASGFCCEITVPLA